MIAAERAYEDTTGYNGERRLWRAVLAALCQDALGAGWPFEADEQLYHTALARVWVRSESFDDVCDLADMDPEAVRDGMRRKMDA
ncbi:hypothetical protein [Inquilinus sp. OTU3971]|uniref:hypothetical protein n=1 Tax=Inquilinus sp. OTU3971 TaxID=3043855 RepID=UPI00313E4D14